MELSQRALEMPFSPIRKLVPYANEAKRRGLKVYHLNIGQPDIKTPQRALSVLKHIDRDILEYSPSDGIQPLRHKITEYYSKFGVELAEDEVIVTSGGSEAVLFSFMACLNPGDEIIVTDPFYANYLSFAISVGAKIVNVKTSIENGFALPSIEAFEEKITPRTKAILICNPNNPTGYLYSKDELYQLRDIVIKHNLYLFCDEVYREFCYSDEAYFSALKLEGVEENVVVIDSVSKRYSECGVRIGYVCSKNKSFLGAVMKFAQARLCPPLLGQLVATASMDVEPDYLQGVYNEYIQRRDFLIEGLNKIPGVYSPLPRGAFYTIAHLPVEDTEDFCKWCLSDFSYEGSTIMMAPAAGFYANPEDGKQEVRIAYVLCKEDLSKAIKILEKALELYPRKKI